MLKAVIFDMDGVIIDSEPLHFEADMLTMKDYGKELPEETLIAYVGVSGPEMWADLIPLYGLPDTLEEVIARQLAHKKELLGVMTLEAILGIPELLEQARAAGHKIAVASSSPRFFIETVIEKLGIAHYFEAVVSGEEVRQSKPAPDVFLKAAEELDVPPEYCLVIEDSGHGTCAAKAAGMACVGFFNPNSGIQDLSAADKIVDAIGKIKLEEF
jgi:HAD superfamily hydrolase (TIGR01509 family)